MIYPYGKANLTCSLAGQEKNPGGGGKSPITDTNLGCRDKIFVILTTHLRFRVVLPFPNKEKGKYLKQEQKRKGKFV